MFLFGKIIIRKIQRLLVRTQDSAIDQSQDLSAQIYYVSVKKTRPHQLMNWISQLLLTQMLILAQVILSNQDKKFCRDLVLEPTFYHNVFPGFDLITFLGKDSVSINLELLDINDADLNLAHVWFACQLMSRYTSQFVPLYYIIL